MQPRTGEYRLKDFYLAVVLRTFNFKLTRLEKESGNFVTFVFQDPKLEAEKTIKKYWSKELTCDPRSLLESFNELKTRLHSGS